MRFALVNQKLVEAKTGLAGVCPSCSDPVVAKCGINRVHHWAHRGQKMCDQWWEPETEWHRTWKNNFPFEWQEIFLPDERNGEKHIADIRTPNGLIIEFQHSNIAQQERNIRENFYIEMVWVVDGTRLKKDFSRFVKARNIFRKGYKSKIFYVDFPEDCFPSAWIHSSVPIIFDFFDSTSSPEEWEIRQPLYCLLPMKMGSCTIVAEIPRKAFIETIRNDEWLNRLQNFIKEIDQVKVAQHEDRQRKKERYYRVTSGLHDKDISGPADG